MSLGSIVGAIGSFAGGLFGQSSQDKQVRKQIDAQREFAQNGIRWRVEDATRAGIHPLYALGANTHSFAPIGIGGSPLAEGISQAGNAIGRGIEAKGTQVERAYNAKMMALQLQRGELENMVLASRLARENSPTQRQPAFPVVGQGLSERFGIPGQAEVDRMIMPVPERFGGTVAGTSAVVASPLERIWDAEAPWREPGAVAEGSWLRTPTGMVPAPSYDANERMEDVFGPDIAWSWRNMVLPNFVDDDRVKPPAPDGYEWMWSIARQEYQLVKR